MIMGKNLKIMILKWTKPNRLYYQHFSKRKQEQHELIMHHKKKKKKTKYAN